HGGARGGLHAVVERIERGSVAQAAAKSREDQPVGEPWVLGQDRTVKIGADGAAIARTLEAVLPVVALADDDSGKGLGRKRGLRTDVSSTRDTPLPNPPPQGGRGGLALAAEIRPSAVILEAD